MVIGSPNEATTTVGLPDTAAYKQELFESLGREPLDRFIVQGLNPFQLDNAGLVTLTATVTTSSGTYTKDVAIHTALPWKPNPGLQNVPVGIPVLLHGKNLGDGAVYDWSLTKPANSAATLIDATTQNPYFTPDLSGVYTVTVTDSTVQPAQVVNLQIDAGNWVGAITGQDADGRPEASACTGCHREGGIAPDNFTPWAHSGHAEIFTQNFNTPGHYNTDCLTCHSVGWDLAANNGGMDDAPNYQNFLNEFTSDGHSFVGDPNNWSNLLSMFPDVAKLANVQCENCHGPNSTPCTPTVRRMRRASPSPPRCAACATASPHGTDAFSNGRKARTRATSWHSRKRPWKAAAQRRATAGAAIPDRAFWPGSSRET